MVGAVLEVGSQFPSPGVVNYPRTALAYRVLSAHQDHGQVREVPVMSHPGKVGIHAAETCLIFKTEHKNDSIHPVAELQRKYLKTQLNDDGDRNS